MVKTIVILEEVCECFLDMGIFLEANIFVDPCLDLGFYAHNLKKKISYIISTKLASQIL
jgi:hypothetical protein